MDNNYAFWNGWNGYLNQLPDLLLALVVLLLGWIIAKAVEKAVLKGLRKTNLDNKLFAESGNRKYSPEKIISKIVYILILIFVFIWFFNILNLSFLATPLVGMFSTITGAIPSILKAALILLVAWLVASALKFLIKRGGRTLRVHETLNKYKFIKGDHDSSNIVDKAANIVFYLVLLISLPAVLSALNLEGVSGPFASMLNDILAFLPKLLAAALILFIGWFIAKLVRDIVTSFLQSIGTEKLVGRFGLSKLFEGTTLSSVAGYIVFVFIMIPVVIAALEELDLEGISQPAIAMLNDVLTMIPNIIVAIAFILAGIWLGKWVRQMVASLLERIGADSYFNSIGFKKNKTGAAKSGISQLIGYIAQIIVILLFVVQALNLLKLDFLVTLATGVIAYLPNVLAALVILGAGLWLGTLVKKLLSSLLEGPHFRLLSSVAQYAIVAISIFMALDQLGVAHSIVNSAFILILGGLALAFGLAFGLGGKDFAAKYLQKLDRKIEQTSINKDARTTQIKESMTPDASRGTQAGDSGPARPMTPDNADPINPEHNRMNEKRDE
ncbi:mechanosensitive ion channel [Bacillus infantis]|uniref:mechanosensitive ion channel n=1 Tax=Bacillus infantis TaxID=324767 RepID=UPI002FBE7756